MFDGFIKLVRNLYPNQEIVLLHSPAFIGKEKEYLNDCIDTTFVSYVGKYVTQFEEMTAAYTGAKYAVAIVNGTAALQIALQLAGVEREDEVITQPLTFVATANAISHCGAIPIFIDVDLDTMGLSPEKLYEFLKKNSENRNGYCYNKISERKISAIVPMHTFGFPCRIDEVVKIGKEYNIPIIEDSAESLGSFFKVKHTGTYGLAGIISYNGNKTITTGGGGMIITDDEDFAKKAKYITTTGKIPHKWEYAHDIVAYNYRMPNINAALGVAQMEYFDKVLCNKREIAKIYKQYFDGTEIEFFSEPQNSNPNYWLNAIRLRDRNDRDKFLEFTNSRGIMTRPIWQLMNKLNMYKDCQTGNLDNSEKLEGTVVNIPSGYRV